MNTDWTARAVTAASRVVLKDATLSSDWSDVPNMFVLDAARSPEFEEEKLRTMDGQTDHCDTLSHIF